MSLYPYRPWQDVQYQAEGTLHAWRMLNLASNAIMSGYAGNLMPSLDSKINVEEAKQHIRRVENKWDEECKRRDVMKSYTGSPPFTQMPDNAQVWLHEQIEYLRK